MEISSSTASYYQQDPRNQAGSIDSQHEGLKADVPGSTGGTITSRSVDASNQAEKVADGVKRGEDGDRASNARKSDTESSSESRPEEKAEARNGKEMSLEDAQMVDELVARDREVRTHEQAHAAVGGQYAGAPTYTFQRGPDGQNYAVGGEVSIDTSEIPGDPRATMEKMRTVVAAANAPAEPSGQDRKVASQASAKINEAAAELVKMEEEERVEQQEKAAEASKESESGEATDAMKGDDSRPEANRSPESRAADSDEPELTQSLASRTEAQSSMDRKLAGTGAVDGTEQGSVISSLV